MAKKREHEDSFFFEQRRRNETDPWPILNRHTSLLSCFVHSKFSFVNQQPVGPPYSVKPYKSTVQAVARPSNPNSTVTIMQKSRKRFFAMSIALSIMAGICVGLLIFRPFSNFQWRLAGGADKCRQIVLSMIDLKVT